MTKFLVAYLILGFVYLLLWMSTRKFYEIWGEHIRKLAKENPLMPRRVFQIIIVITVLWVVLIWPHSLYCDIKKYVFKKD